MKKHDYLTICPPETNSDQFSVTVGPKSVKLIKFKIDPAGGGGYSLALSFSYSVKLGEDNLL